MSVLIETSLGVIVLDLFIKECPKTCMNFLKLCKIKFYNNCLFYDVQKDFLAQTGDPENTGRGGNSVWGIIKGENFRYFEDEIHPTLRHNKLGTISTGNLGPNMNTSTFFIQLTDNPLHYLNDKHTVFGRVEEGFEVLQKINKTYADKENRPFQNIRIKHTIVLDDPFEDPEGLIVPSRSPDPVKDLEYSRLEDDVKVNELFKNKETEEQVKEKLQEHEARNRAIVLEMLEDLPDADVKPPENVLFVCKLNPVTQDDDLELIFSRFGPIKSCQIIRDGKSGESLQYAFIEFEKVEDCERAYFKMNGVIIDERRIKVDFSQSVSKLWFNLKKAYTSNVPEELQTKKPNDFSFPDDHKLELRYSKDFMNHKEEIGNKLVIEGRKIAKEETKVHKSRSHSIEKTRKSDRDRKDDKNEKRSNRDDKYKDSRARHDNYNHNKRNERQQSHRKNDKYEKYDKYEKHHKLHKRERSRHRSRDRY
jgi:peptidyl-prolyl cis-trans isomerase-like 4